MEIKDRPLNMPCSDPEGCKHFKAEIQLNKRIKEFEEALQKIKDIEDDWDNCIPECDVCAAVQLIAEQALKGKQ